MKLFGKRNRESTGNVGNQSIEENREDRVKIDFDSSDISKKKTSSSFDTSATKERVESSQNKGENKHVKSTIDQIIHKDFHLLNSKQRRQLKRHRAREIENIRETQGRISDKSSIKISQQRSSDDNGSLIELHSGYGCTGNDSATVTVSITKDSIDLSIAESGIQEIDNRREVLSPEAELFNKQGGDTNFFLRYFGSYSQEKSIQDALNIDPAERNSKQRRLVKRYNERGGDALNDRDDRGKWSHLPDVERKRRENQRQMQKEAAKRRAINVSDANAEISCLNDNRKRHPLNSERRRANKRKPKRVRQMIAKKREAESNSTV